MGASWCTSCGTGRLSPLPAPDELAGFYPAAYYGDPSDAKFLPAVEWAVRKIGAERQKNTELNQQLHVLEQTLKG